MHHWNLLMNSFLELYNKTPTIKSEFKREFNPEIKQERKRTYSETEDDHDSRNRGSSSSYQNYPVKRERYY